MCIAKKFLTLYISTGTEIVLNRILTIESKQATQFRRSTEVAL
jgi:hypothetical protein